jgi:hypothetical protein
MSLLVFFLAMAGCEALEACFPPRKPGPDHAFEHADLFLMDIVLGGILGGTLGLVSLIRGERPRLPAIIGLALNLLPVFGVICFLMKLRSL